MKPQEYALITGASNGIGKSLAHECARRSMNLILVALPGSGLEAVRADLAFRYGVDVRCIEGDLSDHRFILELHRQVTISGIPISVLINNAGIGYEGKFDEQTIGFCNTMLQLNMNAVVLMSRLFLPSLLRRESSFIMNVSSLASFTPMPYKSMYAASKTFVYSFSRALRSELRGTSVSVSVVCPGAVPTGIAQRQRIEAHGYLAKVSSIHPEELAHWSIERMIRGQEVIIPGRLNRFSRLLMRLVPEGVRLQLLAAAYGKSLPALTTAVPVVA